LYIIFEFASKYIKHAAITLKIKYAKERERE
jgi:hypothetical protein